LVHVVNSYTLVCCILSFNVSINYFQAICKEDKVRLWPQERSCGGLPSH